MEAVDAEFFLFLGNATSEASTSKLKAARVPYIWKRLESGADNWRKIIGHLDDPGCLGVIAQLSSGTINQMSSDDFRGLTRQLLASVGRSRHAIFVHEGIVAPIPPKKVRKISDRPSHHHHLAGWAQNSDEDEDLDRLTEIGVSNLDWDPDDYFSPPEERSLEFVREVLAENGITVTPYKTNAELSVLAARFLEQAEKHLLFRIYVPSGRLWAEEADKLLSLFRDWLGRVKGRRVRQDGYSTTRGKVYEFYGDDSVGDIDLTGQFDEFSVFLSACLDRPDEAVRILDATSMDAVQAYEVVARYSKEARRLKVDIRQARESRLLSLRHRLEDELSELDASDLDIARIADAVVPRIDSFELGLSSPRPAIQITSPGDVSVAFSSQVIGTVNGIAAQQVQGTQNFGVEARQLLELINAYGGDQRADLASSVHELEDDDARRQDRIAARQRLKAFMYGLGNQAAGVATGLLTKYLETRLGLGG
ncbi:hypothetical protein OHQ88_32925 [Micromonospora zamorensis]|uniref:hypothetical protein n=1 Tax=Micromonospora zamorensis TaxID=709883 RepID=UPI002E220069